MHLIRRKKFLKAFLKLQKNQQDKVLQILEVFQKDPFDPILYNHALAGQMQGLRSISVGGDLRLIFEEKDNYLIVIFVAIGSHAQLY